MRASRVLVAGRSRFPLVAWRTAPGAGPTQATNELDSRTARATLIMSLATLVVTLSCTPATAQFTRTDRSFLESRRATPPDLYLDAAPAHSYRTVGRVAVTLPSDTPLARVREALQAKGQDVGCDALVEPSLEKGSSMLFGDWTASSDRLVHGPGHGPAQPPTRAAAMQQSADQKFEYLCAVYGRPSV